MTPHSIESSEIQIPLIYTAPLEYKCEINTSFCHHSSNPTGAFGTSNLSPYYTILQLRIVSQTAGYSNFTKSLTRSSFLLFFVQRCFAKIAKQVEMSASRKLGLRVCLYLQIWFLSTVQSLNLNETIVWLGGGEVYSLLCSVPWSTLLRLPSRPHPKWRKTQGHQVSYGTLYPWILFLNLCNLFQIIL